MSINRTALLAAANTIGNLAQAWMLDETSGTTAAADVSGGQDLTHTNGPVVSADGVDYDGVDDHTTHADNLTTQGNKAPPITMVIFVRTLDGHQAGTLFSYNRTNNNNPQYEIRIGADGTITWHCRGTSQKSWGANTLVTETEYMLSLIVTSSTVRDGRINKGTREAGDGADIAQVADGPTRRIHTVAGNRVGTLAPALIHVDAALKFDAALTDEQLDGLYDEAYSAGVVGGGPLIGGRLIGGHLIGGRLVR